MSRHLAIALLASTSASLALAQEASSDTIIVTGTRAKTRTELNTPTPVDILTRDDLTKAAGPGGDLGSALQTLLPSFNMPKQSNSSGADHVRAAQLRGMSPDQVLVLVNGKRRHTSAIVNLDSKIGKGTNPVDFGSIPVSAIKRIEVLRDGAGAQYGSDAVAGVINVILEDSAGGEISASYGQYNTKFEPTGQRIRDGESPEVHLRYGFKTPEARINFGADFGRHAATNRAGLDQVPFFEQQTPDNLALAGQRNYAAGDSEQRNAGLWTNAAAQMGALEAYAFATYNHRESVGSGFFRYPDSDANVRSIYPNGFRPETTGKNADLSVVGGIRGPMAAEWTVDASAAYGRNSLDYGVRRSLNASLGDKSPTTFDLGHFSFDQLTANVDASRELALLGKGSPLTFATGAEARREGFRTKAGDAASYSPGSVFDVPIGAQAGPGLQPSDAAKTNRSVVGAYVDVSGDLSPSIFADAAARYDHYSDFGGALTAKLSGRFELSKAVALRGAVSSNYRAPSLAQSSFSFTTTAFGTGGALSSVRTVPVGGDVGKALGLPELKAEKSTNISAGLTFAPSKSFNASIDAYNIDLKNRITLSERFSGEALTDALSARGLAGVDGINFFTNAVDTRTKGVDVVASYAESVAGGNLRLSLASAWSKTSIRNIRATPASLVALGLARDLVGLEEQNTITTATPKARHVLTTAWNNSSWSIVGRITRNGQTTRVFDFGDGFVPTQTYAARTQFDLELEYKLNKQLNVAIGGINITDKYPTRSIDDIAYFGNLPYDVLSPIGFNGAYYYARLQYRF